MPPKRSKHGRTTNPLFLTGDRPGDATSLEEAKQPLNTGTKGHNTTSYTPKLEMHPVPTVESLSPAKNTGITIDFYGTGQSTNGVNCKQVGFGFDTVNHATGVLDVSKQGPRSLIQSGIFL